MINHPSAITWQISEFLQFIKLIWIFTAKCPNGYKLYNNICYKYFPGPVNWVQASEKCAADFATLASIGSQAEDIFVRTVLVRMTTEANNIKNQGNYHSSSSGLTALEKLFSRQPFFKPSQHNGGLQACIRDFNKWLIFKSIFVQYLSLRKTRKIN